MSLLGSSMAQSIAGTQQAERIAARDVEKSKDPKPKAPRRAKDEFERHVTEVETAEAIERPASDGEREQPGERANRDPRNSQAYNASGVTPQDAEPNIDIKG